MSLEATLALNQAADTALLADDTALATLGAAKLAGQLGGPVTVPDVRGLRETAGPALLTMGPVAGGRWRVPETLRGQHHRCGSGRRV